MLNIRNNVIQKCDIIIFGAKGDLARRKLLPALYQLEKAKKIHQKSKIIAVGRADWDKNIYLSIVYDSLKKFMKEKIDVKILNNFNKKIEFCNLDVNKTNDFIKLEKIISIKKQIIISYFAMPPHTFQSICKGLGFIKFNNIPNSRVIMEKPLGNSLKTSQEINNQVSYYFKENQVFRIDHYLGKEMVLNLLSLRFANSILFNWSNKNIDHIQITVAEEVGIENRWNYFNNVGQMRDMIQNHLLQLLTIITMSPPINLSADSIRDEKVKILKSLRPIKNKNIVRGQYIAGKIQGKKVPGYLEEIGSAESSNIETFVSLKVNIDNWRWYGVPFYLRTGKRLYKKCSEIVIFFKQPDINLFKNLNIILSNNKLTIRLQPNEGIDLEILNKIPGLSNNLKITKLNLNYSEVFPQQSLVDAYERLLLEAIKGIQSLFVRKDEVEEAWKWIDNIISQWNTVPLNLYKAGTWGPTDSKKLINRDGRKWNTTI